MTAFEINDHNQIDATYDDESRTEFTYDGNDNVLETRVLPGDSVPSRVVRAQYDVLGRIVSSEEASPATGGASLSQVTTFEYDADENRTLMRSPLGYTRESDFDERQLETQIDTGGSGPRPVSGQLAVFEYDEAGNREVEFDGEGNQTRRVYNGFDELIKEIDPNGFVTEFVYDRRGLIKETLRRVSDDGPVVSRVMLDLDEIGRVRSRTECVFEGTISPEDCPNPATTLFVYDERDRIVEQIDADRPNERVTSRVFDGLGREVLLTDAANNVFRSSYDGLDLTNTIAEENSPHGVVRTRTSFTFDQHGRLVAREVGKDGEPPSYLEGFEYDSQDRETKSFVLDGALHITEVSTSYDALGRVSTVTNGNEIRRYGYDGDGRLESELDAAFHGIDYVLDGRSRIRERIYADGSKETISYAADDVIAQMVDRAGNVRTYDYDVGNRLEHLTVSRDGDFSGTTNRDFEYDALDRIVKATAVDPGLTGDSYAIVRGYDSRGLMTREELMRGESAVGSVVSIFNQSDERIGLGYRDSTGNAFRSLRIARTVLGTVQSISNANSATAIASYDYAGPRRVARVTFGNDTEMTRGFGSVRFENEVEYREVGGAQQVLSGYELRRDAARRVSSLSRSHDSGAGDIYTYTPEGWLESAREGLADPFNALPGDPAFEREYGLTYDAAGNWSERATDGTPAAYDRNDLNQYTMIGTETLGYDGNGNLVEHDGERRIYDAFGQVVRVESVATGAELAAYFYDAFGRRVRTQSPSTVRQYVYDGSSVAFVLDGGGGRVQEFVYAEGEVAPIQSRLAAGEADYFYQKDHVGSVVAAVDSDGLVVERYAYDVFGVASIVDSGGLEIASSAFETRFGFAGGWLSTGSELVRFGVRDYLAGIGRFVQPDPAGTVDGLNLHVYAGNDPVNFVDPSGLYRAAIESAIGLGNRLGFISLTDRVGSAFESAVGAVTRFFRHDRALGPKERWAFVAGGVALNLAAAAAGPAIVAAAASCAVVCAPAIVAIGAVVTVGAIVDLATGGFGRRLASWKQAFSDEHFTVGQAWEVSDLLATPISVARNGLPFRDTLRNINRASANTIYRRGEMSLYHREAAAAIDALDSGGVSVGRGDVLGIEPAVKGFRSSTESVVSGMRKLTGMRVQSAGDLIGSELHSDVPGVLLRELATSGGGSLAEPIMRFGSGSN